MTHSFVNFGYVNDYGKILLAQTEFFGMSNCVARARPLPGEQQFKITSQLGVMPILMQVMTTGRASINASPNVSAPLNVKS